LLDELPFFLHSLFESLSFSNSNLATMANPMDGTSRIRVKGFASNDVTILFSADTDQNDRNLFHGTYDLFRQSYGLRRLNKG